MAHQDENIAPWVTGEVKRIIVYKQQTPRSNDSGRPRARPVVRCGARSAVAGDRLLQVFTFLPEGEGRLDEVVQSTGVDHAEATFDAAHGRGLQVAGLPGGSSAKRRHLLTLGSDEGDERGQLTRLQTHHLPEPFERHADHAFRVATASEGIHDQFHVSRVGNISILTPVGDPGIERLQLCRVAPVDGEVLTPLLTGEEVGLEEKATNGLSKGAERHGGLLVDRWS